MAFHLATTDITRSQLGKNLMNNKTPYQGSAIEVLGSPDHGCGIVCPLNCESKTFASPSLGSYLRHFCSLRLGALWLLCFNGTAYKHSYLLTYLQLHNGFTVINYVCCRIQVKHPPITNTTHCFITPYHTQWMLL